MGKKKGNQLSLHKGVIKITEVFYPICKWLTEFWGRKHSNRAVNSYLWSISHFSGLKLSKVLMCKAENKWLLAFLSSCVPIFSRALFIWLGARNMGSLFTLHEQGWQENRFLSVLLLSLVATLASGMFISASSEDLKVGSRIWEHILRHVGSEGLFNLSCLDYTYISPCDLDMEIPPLNNVYKSPGSNPGFCDAKHD